MKINENRKFTIFRKVRRLCGAGKGLANAKILNVNGLKVSGRLGFTEYWSIFFLTFIVLIIMVVIKKKMK